MLASWRKPQHLLCALIGIVALVILFVGLGSRAVGAQDNDDDEFNLIGQGGDARIISPIDGETVDWPFTMVIQADEPGLGWSFAEILSPHHPVGLDLVLFEFDENGRAEIVFDGPFPAWALEESWSSRYVEVFGAWEDPDTGESGGFFDDTILRINRPERRAPIISLDDAQTPISIPTTLSGTIDSETAIVDVSIKHDGQIQSNVTFDDAGNFTVDLHSTYNRRAEVVDDAVISLLIGATDALGARALESFDLRTTPPSLTLDPFDPPDDYPIELSGTIVHDGISAFPQIFVELDWDNRDEIEIHPTIASDGTWTATFDPRFVLGWVYEPGEVLGMSFRFADHAGRSAAAHTQIDLPPQFLYCDGYGVTVDLLKGDVPTTGDDIILGGPVRDVINGLAGDDVICSLGGWDIIDGGPGNDTIIAGNGRDRVTGGDGWDIIYGGGGADTIYSGPGNDEVSGGRGNDVIYLGGGNDLAVGNEGNDEIYGGQGRDELFGRLGSDDLRGGGGADLLVGGVGADKIFGQAGNDRAFGEAGRDRIDLGGGQDLALGGPGNDVILGQAGDDRMAGEDGDDTLIGGSQRDYAIGGAGRDVCDAEIREECER